MRRAISVGAAVVAGLLAVPSGVATAGAAPAAARAHAASVGPVGSPATGPAPLPAPGAPDPRQFTTEIDNRYFPLEPGTTFVYRGVKEGEPQQAIVTVTHRTVRVQNVRCVVVTDVVTTGAGKPVERTEDWYAQDRRGNVWYFGEDSFDYIDGRWVRSTGSWKAGVDGARAGFIMKAHPKRGERYYQEYYRGHAEDQARVLGKVRALTVPAGYYRNLLKTEEFTRLEPDVRDQKYYAPGVGFVRGVTVRGGNAYTQLVSVTDEENDELGEDVQRAQSEPGRTPAGQVPMTELHQAGRVAVVTGAARGIGASSAA